MFFVGRVSHLLTPAPGKGTCRVSLGWGQAVTSPVPRGVWRLEQFGPVTLMHSVLLCGHRPLSVNKIRGDFLYPMGFLDATISIWEDFKTQECEFIDTAVRKAEKLSSLKLPASLAVQCWYKTTEEAVLATPFLVSSEQLKQDNTRNTNKTEHNAVFTVIIYFKTYTGVRLSV